MKVEDCPKKSMTGYMGVQSKDGLSHIFKLCKNMEKLEVFKY